MSIRKIRIALVAAVGSLLFTLSASAQLDDLKNTTPEQRAKALTEMMTTKLGLSPEQTSKVADLNLKYANKMEPLIKGSEGPFAKMREMREVNEAKQTELQQILTPQQFQNYLASKEQMREKMLNQIEQKANGAGQ
jgi:hypothetical protein